MATIDVYTDGSYDNNKDQGAWAAIIFYNDEKTVLSGTATNATHNRMELTAAIKAIEFIMIHFPQNIIIQIFSDSQYLIGLPQRQAKLESKDFMTSKGKMLPNTDLVKTFLAAFSTGNITLTKVKAHQKKGETVNHNIEVDMLSRKLVRTSPGI